MMDNKENHFDSYEDKMEMESNSAILYEMSRIKPLAEQRDEVQKKTFTKWINAHLSKSKDSENVKDLCTDLQDGKVLLKLLETISGETLPKPSKGKMRIHYIENISKSLRFLDEQHVYLENLGAHDIVDGNQTLILGLVWTLILRFQIQYATPDYYDGTKTSKDALLLWCQMKTAGYKNVNVRNFTTSWKDGLAFNAILHKHDPDVVDFVTMSKNNPVENMNTAFQIAEKVYGVPQLLDPKDIAVDQPDERSIMTYVGLLSQILNKLKSDTVKSKRLGNVLNEAIGIEKMIEDYELDCKDLLDWINSKIDWMENEKMRESLPGVQEQLGEFKDYRLEEKPPKFRDRGVLEMNFFEIQSKLRNDNRKLYIPPDGKLISDINRAWNDLERAEHRMELKLYEELIRQEKLDQLGSRFNRKAQMKKVWLYENDRLVQQSIFGDNLVTVDAAIKKHEALEGDICAHADRIQSLGTIVDELEIENYYKVDEIKESYDMIVHMWEKLLADLSNRREKLEKCREIQLLLKETEYILDWISEISSRLQTKDFGKHLLGVENLIEKQKILSSDIRNIDNRIVDIRSKISNSDFDTDSIDPDKVRVTDELLQESYDKLVELSLKRDEELAKYKVAWELIDELDNDKEWIKEICQLMQNPDIGHDLKSLERLIRKHEQIKCDVNIRKEIIDKKVQEASSYRDLDDCRERKHLLKDQINDVEELLDHLKKYTKERDDKLKESLKYYQLLADIDDATTMILEERRLFDSTEVGDKQSLTEYYLTQFKEQKTQVDILETTVQELLDRKDDLDLTNFDRRKEADLNDSCDKMQHDFEELCKLIQFRKHLLDNSLTKFHLLNDIDSVETWIVAKEKFLHTLIPTEEIDELNVIKHRFDCFIDQMHLNSDKLTLINDVSQQLIDSDHPEASTISTNQNNINREWNDLTDLTNDKQKELDQSLAYNQFLIECQETCSWIKDKMKLLEWTDDLKDDLDGVMQLQRRLGSLQRDVQAVEAKVKYLNQEAVTLKEVKPAAEESIDAEMTTVNELWSELKIMLQDRDARLNSSNELQKFLQDLDSFNVWLSNKQKEVASQDIPNDLQEAEKLFSQHQSVKEEIHCWSPEFKRLLEFGRKLSQSKDDSQYLLFNQRLNGLEDGWNMLERMCADKDITLRQSINAQIFIRDALQVDSILTKQETFLAKEDIPISIEAFQDSIRQFETFKTSVASNQPKIDSVLNFGGSLINNNALSDKIRNKCDQISDRCAAIHYKIGKRDQALRDELKLKTYLDDVMDLEEWIAEKMIVASNASYRDVKDISARYNRFKDFQRELEANNDRIQNVIKLGEDMIDENPKLESEIEPKIGSINNQWAELMQTVQDRINGLEDANREVIFEETANSMMSWVTEISSQIITTEEITEEIGLVEINEKMKDQDDKDKQLEQKRKMLNDIADHAVKLSQKYPDRVEEFDRMEKEVRVKLTEVEAPMAHRREKLFQHKKVQQLFRDLQDEKEWIEDKLRVIRDNEVSPETLQVCMQKVRRLKSLATEIDNHKARIDDVKMAAICMIEDQHPNSEKFETDLKELDDLWRSLLDSLHHSQTFFDENREVHEYLSDASESESWMLEREFDLLRDEKIKDEEGALNSVRKHDELTSVIQHYVSVISELGDRSNHISIGRLHGWHAVVQRQEKVDKMYASLVDMCLDRRLKIEDLVKFHHLQRLIQDLEEWIAERTVVACSHEIGSELEHCILLRDRFAEFALDTNEMGGNRVSNAILMCDNLIAQGHQEAPEIANWKDRINEAWADLLELIETRIQLLKAVSDFFKFMNDSADLIDRLREKVLLIPEGIGKDAKTVASYQRKHAAFVLEISGLKPYVDSAINTATQLLEFYSSVREQELIERRSLLHKLWCVLNDESDNRNNVLMDATDYFRFSSMVRELMHWLAEIEQQVRGEDKARDVCGVEVIISNHRSLRAEIDSRDESRSICVTLGRTLINRHHPMSDDIRKKCATVIEKHFKIKDEWLEKQEYLEMILEVYQFARDAAVAESWLMAQEPQVHTDDVGDSLLDTLNLIQKHQNLERTLSTQDERFYALRKLTILEEKERSVTDAMKSAKRERQRNKLEEVLAEFRTPVPTPKEVSRRGSEVAKGEEEVMEAKVVVTEAKVVVTEAKDIKQMIGAPVVPEPMAGEVNRKHEWESQTKKAGNRAWHTVYMCLADKKLSFYKDEKHYQDDKNTTYRHETPLSLVGGSSFVASSYKKRAHVLRVRLATGSEYLVQAGDEQQMHRWVDAINEAGGLDPSKMTSTLPAMRSEFAQDVGGKKKFPTLTRKQK